MAEKLMEMVDTLAHAGQPEQAVEAARQAL
jgi:hypothetical protein